MKQEVLKQFEHTGLPILALIIFLAFFFGVVFWVMRKDKKKSFEKASEMPLDEAEAEVVEEKEGDKNGRGR